MTFYPARSAYCAFNSPSAMNVLNGVDPCFQQQTTNTPHKARLHVVSLLSSLHEFYIKGLLFLIALVCKFGIAATPDAHIPFHTNYIMLGATLVLAFTGAKRFSVDHAITII
ncbi:hypothetical protein JD969_06890 [Planctomycetota bacterium]|nr:hypothetical protein JD969_06890 [Planctomycetota bacterium]